MRELTKEEAKQILIRHGRCFATHATKDLSFRLEMLLRLKWAIKFYESEALEALKTDLGKHPAESYITEVGYIYNSINEMVKKLRTWAKPVHAKTPLYMLPSKSYILHDPYGTVLIIGPFNYPFQLVFEPLIGAIAAGNCAVVKPSELSPSVANVVEKIIKKAFRRAYVECVQGGVATNTSLLSAGFDYIFFTGSPAIGRVVMEAAAKMLTPVTLELGGKSPVIVDKTADIKLSAKRILWGKTMNAGQTCVAPDYVFVHEDVKEALIKELKRTLISFYGKDAKASESFGRIINKRHMERLTSILKRDKAHIVYGGSYDMESRYIEPTLLDHVTFNSACMQEELFGPLLPILSYRDIDSVTRQINRHSKPLALYVFSRDKELIRRMLRKTSSGGVCINDVISHVANPNLPFGGVGNSGMGAYHAKESFLTFSHRKSVFENQNSLSNALTAPPYKNYQLALLKMIFR